jgi:hypothetical protein
MHKSSVRRVLYDLAERYRERQESRERRHEPSAGFR